MKSAEGHGAKRRVDLKVESAGERWIIESLGILRYAQDDGRRVTLRQEMREGCSAGGAGLALGLRLRTKLRRLRRVSEAWSIFFQKAMK
jgi:hypothetical protein